MSSAFSNFELPQHLPVFGPESARCPECELKKQCETDRWVPAQLPKGKWNGLMIVGEGPGKHEIIQKIPFVGPSGHLLDALLEAADIKREETVISNATLCLPTSAEGRGDAKKGFHKRFPTALPSCLPRLEAELAAIRPRVVVCMGAAAALAAHGHFVERTKQIDNPCERCNPVDRKLGPGIACANGECNWYALWQGMTDVQAEPLRQSYMEELNKLCPKCGARIDRLKLRRIKCPECKGRKKKLIKYEAFEGTFSMTEAAGGLWSAADLPSRWDEFGVRYVITTFHPSFCLHEPPKESKVFGGQHAARAVVDHLEKARRLLARDALFDLEVIITDQATDVVDYLEEHGPGLYVEDIETNAEEPWDVSEIRCIGIGRADSPVVLVVDTRRLFIVKTSQVDSESPLCFDIQVNPEYQALFNVLVSFSTDPVFLKLGQNYQYDCLVKRRFFKCVTAPIAGDLKLAHHMLYPDEPHKLGHIAMEVTEGEYWKPPKKKGNTLHYEGGFTELCIYNAKDVRTTALAHEALAGSLR